MKNGSLASFCMPLGSRNAHIFSETARYAFIFSPFQSLGHSGAHTERRFRNMRGKHPASEVYDASAMPSNGRFSKA